MPVADYFTAPRCLAATAMLMLPCVANAHVSEQGLVLLLPTDFYIASGVLVVILTLLLLLFLPVNLSAGLFKKQDLYSLPDFHGNRLQTYTSLLSLIVLALLLYLGISGTRDPLENPLPLFIWTVWWIGLPLLQAVFGDSWQWLNPWLGVYRLATNHGWRAPFVLPQSVGLWPGILIFILFTSFALADIAPDSPRRLAYFVGGYWCFTMLCMLLFGEQWLIRGECFSMLMNRFSKLSVFGVVRSIEPKQVLAIGLSGWKLMSCKASSVSAAIFILVLLGSGSFDGLNETFTWLAMIGVNPLEFPGRSAVVSETVTGLLVSNLLLIVVYGFCVFAGVWIANHRFPLEKQISFTAGFCALAISVLPIAVAYHFTHYLVTLLVNGQYVIAALSDPLANGADWLNLGAYYVTTGFLNTPASVKTIWLTQAGAVVTGHVVSVLLAHAIAIELFGNARRAIVSQAPLAVFMVAYTFIGLWLLAAPKGA